MSQKDLLKRLSEAIINCDEEEAKKSAAEISKMGMDPLEAIEKHLSPAIKIVGDKFERGEYFLTHLMMAAEAMTAATKALTIGMSEKDRKKLEDKQKKTGSIVIGSVKGDIHDIGKNIVATLLNANGFNVYDIGKDVSPMDFAKKADEVKADIIMLSALMTTTEPAQLDVINYLKDMGNRDRYRILVGGGVTNREWAEEIGADGWAPDASGAVTLVKKLLKVN